MLLVYPPHDLELMLKLSLPVLFVINGLISTTMMLLNKTIASDFPFPLTTVITQNLVALILTIALVLVNNNAMKRPTLKHVVRSLPGTCLFSVLLLMGMSSMQFASLPILSVCSNFRPLTTAVLEFVLYGRRSSTGQLWGLLLLGSGLFLTINGVSGDELVGIGFALVHTVLTSLFAVTDSKLMGQVKSEQTPLGVNAVRLVISEIIMMCARVVIEPVAVFQALSTKSTILLLASGSVCLLAGTFLFEVRKVASATSIQVANICSKLATTLISLITHGDFPPVIAWTGYGASMLGVMIYYTIDVGPKYK
jgi:drug/metabolite transporter (DMT)-like permease